ncbi:MULTISPECIES: hypothetical protein [unclassified Shewanella]|nr:MULTISPECIES: hypothetical protein [unclassified Shewanella]MBB1320935.1 hypothetical protein [Shewanella sp. SR43-8]MBB1390526.1 hypothetical protein [Shewanella sp. SG44-6]|tara:strand:- start:5303 stop:5446 length:144 start_codon:yes stop_codon:yes gene_type:complete
MHWENGNGEPEVMTSYSIQKSDKANGASKYRCLIRKKGYLLVATVIV